MSDLFDLNADFRGGLTVAGGKRQSVGLHVATEGLGATTDSGETHRIGWHELRLSIGGSSGEVVFASDRRGKLRIDCEDPGFLRAIEGAGGNDLADELARLQGDRVSSSRRHRVLWTVTLAAIVAIVWLTPIAFRASLDAVVDSLPYSVDETIGEAVVDEMPVEGAPYEDEVVVAALQEMIDRLQPASALPEATFELRVIDSEVRNAFALPGGYVTVFTGLIRDAERPEQVAGVLAHEMAHVTLRHGLSRVAHSVGLIVGVQLVLGDAGGLLGVATELFTMATVNSYSREQEAEADAEGVRMMIAAGIDPSALGEFFALLEREEGDVPDSLSWMSTHPQHRERIDAIGAQIAAAPPVRAQPFSFDWEAIQARLEPGTDAPTAQDE